MGIALFVVAIILLGFYNAPLWLWGSMLWGYGFVHHWPTVLQWVILLTTLIGTIKRLRQALISKPMIGLLKKLKIVPSISETEKTAIEAGAAWVEKEFFKGNPHLESMLKEPMPAA